MGSVVVLITLLVGLLSGLTIGLARENISAVTGLDADHLAFAAPPDGQAESFANSTVREDAWRTWAGRAGVEAAQPVGIRTLNATAAGERTAAVSAFGVEPDGTLGPEGIGPGRVVLSEQAAEELGVTASTTGSRSAGPSGRSPPSPRTPRTATPPSSGPRSTTGSSSATTAPGPPSRRP